MNVHPPQTEIMEYLDGVLSPGDHGRVQSHLEKCEGCRALSALFAAIDDGVRSAPLPAVAETMSRRVMNAIGSVVEYEHGYRDDRSLRPFIFLLLCGAVMISVALLGSGTGTASHAVSYLHDIGEYITSTIRPVAGLEIDSILPGKLLSHLPYLEVLSISVLLLLLFASIEKLLFRAHPRSDH